MILHYLKNKENKDKKISSTIYLQIIKETNKICNDIFSNNKKDFNIVFEVSSILLIVFFIALNKNKKIDSYYYKQELIALFIRDIDYSLRIEGISDMKIGKYVKLYVKKFYFRIPILEKVFLNNNHKLLSNYLAKFGLFLEENNSDNTIFFYSYLQDLINKIQKLKKNDFRNFDFFK